MERRLVKLLSLRHPSGLFFASVGESKTIKLWAINNEHKWVLKVLPKSRRKPSKPIIQSPYDVLGSAMMVSLSQSLLLMLGFPSSLRHSRPMNS